MDRTWMIDGKRGDPKYDAGLAEFYEFVRNNVKDASHMPCPCDMCLNIKYMSFSEVKIHLEKNNFNPKYKLWRFHGESRVVQRMEEDIDVQLGEIEIEWETRPMKKGIDSLEDSDWDMNSCDMNFVSADEFDDELETILEDRLSKYTYLISYEELIHWCDEAEIGASHIAIFMRYLSDLSDTMKSTSLYGFLFPEPLSKFAAVSEDYRSDYIARAMTCTECGRGRKLIFAAYHERDHWMLAAISPSESNVYWCDPAGHMEPPQFFVEIVTRAFEKRNSIDPLAGFDAKPLTWKLIKCPMQPLGSVLCGYYVCRYMLELIKGRYINITPNFMLNAPKTYTVEQIDEVRNIWAEFTLNFKPRSNGE